MFQKFLVVFLFLLGVVLNAHSEPLVLSEAETPAVRIREVCLLNNFSNDLLFVKTNYFIKNELKLLAKLYKSET